MPSTALTNKAYRAPQSGSEATICRLFERVLDVQNVGLDDDFFKIGGHSLLAMRLITSIKQETNKNLPLRMLFSKPTPAEIAAEVDLLTLHEGPELTSKSGHYDDNRIALSYGQKRLWLIDQIDEGSSAYNMPWAMRAGLRPY